MIQKSFWLGKGQKASENRRLRNFSRTKSDSWWSYRVFLQKGFNINKNRLKLSGLSEHLFFYYKLNLSSRPKLRLGLGTIYNKISTEICLQNNPFHFVSVKLSQIVSDLTSSDKDRKVLLYPLLKNVISFKNLFPKILMNMSASLWFLASILFI